MKAFAMGTSHYAHEVGLKSLTKTTRDDNIKKEIILLLLNQLLTNTVEPGYNDIGL